MMNSVPIRYLRQEKRKHGVGVMGIGIKCLGQVCA